MDTYNMIFGSVLAAVAVADLWVVFARDLMMLQQNSYRNERYWRWFSQSGESTNIGRILCCVALMFLLVRHIPFFAGAVIGIIITVGQLVSLIRKKYKKPLVWTPRVRRICAVIWVLAVVIGVAAGLFFGIKGACCAVLSMLIVSPLLLIGANDILAPVEKTHQ